MFPAIMLALSVFAVLLFGGDAAQSCPSSATSCPCIPGLPGKPGEQGPPGPPGTLSSDGLQELRTELIEIVCNNVLHKGITEHCPATSCKAIYESDSTLPSGNYWIKNATGGATQVFCMMNTTNCGDITGGWMRAAFLDMTDPGNTCPENLTYTAINSTRMCRRDVAAGCNSVTYATHMIPYTKVCGRARGYQQDSPDGFGYYLYSNHSTLEDFYVDGLSVTHGSPRNHIWTFAAGVAKDYDYAYCCNCPCATPFAGPASPPFVGENYFCESGNTGNFERDQWYLDDPLWDSQGCASGSTCCDRGGPWFSTTLTREVSDDIEVRMCTHPDVQDADGLGLEQLEILVY